MKLIIWVIGWCAVCAFSGRMAKKSIVEDGGKLKDWISELALIQLIEYVLLVMGAIKFWN